MTRTTRHKRRETSKPGEDGEVWAREEEEEEKKKKIISNQSVGLTTRKCAGYVNNLDNSDSLLGQQTAQRSAGSILHV